MNHLDHDDPNGGMSRDLVGLIGRRRLLALLGGAAAVVLAACGSDDDSDASQTTTASSDAAPSTTAAAAATTTMPASDTTAASATTGVADTAAEIECSTIPQETAGPFPGDGSNGPDVLTDSGAVRSDITSSFGEFSGVADGIPLTVTIDLLDTANGCAAMSGAAVYIWHCDREGRYSLYSDGATGQNYLRGVQEADANGRVTFQSIFPGAYSGRYPHIHFEVFPSLDAAATGSNTAITTSQMALPADVCEAVYAAGGYETSAANFEQTPITRDNVFGDDGGVHQIPTSAGSVDAGFSVALTVPV